MECLAYPGGLVRGQEKYLIAVNDISSATTGFEVDNNQVTLIDASGVVQLLHTSKLKTADLIWDHVITNKMLKPAVSNSP